ncbi:MAG: hypothetical protein ABJF01_11760 [bacterium]
MNRLATPGFAERTAAIAVLVVSCVAFAAREYQVHCVQPPVTMQDAVATAAAGH